jgi:hypothetical protein
MLAPDAAIAQLKAGRQVALSSHGHFHWEMSATLMAQLADAPEELLNSMIAPHADVAAKQLSSESQPFFGEPLLFLRIVWEVAPASFERIMAAIDSKGAEAGWSAALRGEDASRFDRTGERGQRRKDQDTAAWLIERALGRPDALGDIARELRKRMSRKSVPSARLLGSLR